jgi:hypothetical protein
LGAISQAIDLKGDCDQRRVTCAMMIAIGLEPQALEIIEGTAG